MTLADLNVLIADGSAHMASLIVGMLKNVGVRSVATASNSSDALRALRTGAFDALVVDAHLAPIDGIGLTRQIRGLPTPKARGIPIVILFSEADRPLVEAARDAGVTEILRKPLSAKALAVRLEQAVGRPRGFVEAAAYVGPDRRRRADVPAGPERRHEPARDAPDDPAADPPAE
jgi:two-component system, chemotaxis family, chemotaxis protein CheY